MSFTEKSTIYSIPTSVYTDLMQNHIFNEITKLYIMSKVYKFQYTTINNNVLIATINCTLWRYDINLQYCDVTEMEGSSQVYTMLDINCV